MCKIGMHCVSKGVTLFPSANKVMIIVLRDTHDVIVIDLSRKKQTIAGM